MTVILVFPETAVSAYYFSLWPIAQEFSPTGRGANRSFLINNYGDEQVAVVVSITTREIDINGREVNNATSDFRVFPTEILVPAGESRTVWVRWIGDPSPRTELAYRLIAEEVPLKTRTQTSGSAIILIVRYVGSLYVVPPGVTSDLRALSARQVEESEGESRLEVILENRGTKHIILEHLPLEVTVGSITRELDTAMLMGEIVLPQHQRRFVVPWPNDLSAGALQVRLRSTVQY